MIRARTVRAETVLRVWHAAPHARDTLVQLGRFRSHPCTHPLRLVEGEVDGKWRPSLTNGLDPQALSAAAVVDLSERRWTIEEAF